jgi:Ca2+-binding RTX toxin-like protein
MGFTVVLRDAAVQYGISDQSAGLGPGLEAIIGSQTTAAASWGSGALAAGQSGSITLGFAHGFSMVLQVTGSTATALVTGMSLKSPSGVELVSYTGSLFVAPTNAAQGLVDSAALSGNDTITGNSGNNTLEGYAGNDAFDGGGGTDTVVLAGKANTYFVSVSQGVIHTSGADGTDTMTNVERIRFDDSALAFDVTGEAGQVYRLYQAALNRAPDVGGLGYYINVLDQGWGLHDIAGNFLHSPEFNATYGANLSDLQFVQRLYLNVLHRQGEDEGVQYHLNELATGMDRAQVLINFSESPENQAALIGTMRQGMAYIPVA